MVDYRRDNRLYNLFHFRCGIVLFFSRGAIGALRAPAGVLATVIALCVFVSWNDPTTPGGIIPVCPTKAILNVNCPGCGSARMLYSLVHGDVRGALHFNALGLFAVVALVYTFVMWVTVRVRVRPAVPWHQMRWSSTVVLTLVVAWTAVRILPIPAFASLRV